jgi:hypothetical protein
MHYFQLKDFLEIRGGSYVLDYLLALLKDLWLFLTALKKLDNNYNSNNNNSFCIKITSGNQQKQKYTISPQFDPRSMTKCKATDF